MIQPETGQFPLDMVGSTMFGRYPKISAENTYNMFISDNALVSFAGYEKIQVGNNLGNSGRGIFPSVRTGFMYTVFDDYAWSIDKDLRSQRLFQLNTSVGDVFISENNAEQIAFCDKTSRIYVWNATTNSMTIAHGLMSAPLGFTANYVEFQDTYTIVTVGPPQTTDTGQWQLSTSNDSTIFPGGAANVGTFQTKSDNPVAAIRMPGRGSLLLVMGSIVTEAWNDVGLPLFPYQKNTTYNFDYGCVNPATIARLDNYVIWLASNEQSGPVIMYSDGGAIKQISTDGINYVLANLTTPQDSYGFLFKQDGHLFYIITFYTDNLTYAYDFNTQKFFTLTDENNNYFIAKKIVQFNGLYYFISINDGNLYEINSSITTYDGAVIPRTRITSPKRMPGGVPFIASHLTFTLEQGEVNSSIGSAVDMAISNDGGQSFSNFWRKKLNPIGNRANKLDYFQLGRTNDITIMLRFWSPGRVVCFDGILEWKK